MLGDHEELSANAKRIIESRAAEVPLEVLCEVVYVLAGVYKVGREEISAGLLDFFENTASELPHREAALKGLELFAENNLDFVDCVLAGYKLAEGAEVETFDKNLRTR
jgi:predicted nucleic-acid-binding protein